MKRFVFVEHTADIAVLVYGGSLKELFTSAALAMFSVLVAKKKNRATSALRDVVIQKDEEILEDLLKAWLDELLFHFSTEHLILHRIKALNIDGTTLEAKVLLETFDGEYFESKNEIKAVTYHELKVERIRNRWQARIIFDV
jgi:SHS2 domain-containing protein